MIDFLRFNTDALSYLVARCFEPLTSITLVHDKETRFTGWRRGSITVPALHVHVERGKRFYCSALHVVCAVHDISMSWALASSLASSHWSIHLSWNSITFVKYIGVHSYVLIIILLRSFVWHAMYYFLEPYTMHFLCSSFLALQPSRTYKTPSSCKTWDTSSWRLHQVRIDIRFEATWPFLIQP